MIKTQVETHHQHIKVKVNTAIVFLRLNILDIFSVLCANSHAGVIAGRRIQTDINNIRWTAST